ncbi:MAG TPA: hypothetical protein VIR16_05930, partial [Candidatus Limnocylindrales bacterium]
MSEQLDLAQAEALLRKHYAQRDPGPLRSDAAARIRAQLEAVIGTPSAVRRRLRLEPVRANGPRARISYGWSLAATVVVAAMIVTWLAVGRPATPPVAGSPTLAASPAASALASAPATTPTPEPTSPPQPAIADSGVAFFDANNGIAIGNGASHAYLWRTGDGGRTWSTSSLQAASARLMAAHGDHVWISSSSCTANPPDPSACTGAIERSDDRGATWRTISHQALRSISFGDAMHGFGVGPYVQASAGNTVGGAGTGIYETADSGATWTPVAKPRPCLLDPVSVSFASALHGWLGCGGQGGAGNAEKGVLETTDGGRTWAWRARTRVSMPAVGSITTADYLDTISMQADGAGFMTGLRGSTFRTADGGRTWTSSPPGEFDAFTTSQAAIVPGGPWFLIQSG